MIFSIHGRTTGPQAASHRDRVVAAWKVATIGPLAIMQTSSDDRRRRRARARGGRRSAPSRSQRRTRADDTGPNCTLATEPLYGTGTVRPAR